jgi:ubiquinone/menaquinone biosynthesis C-methylase UbiE
MNYEADTKQAYRSEGRAAQYQRYHTRDWSWGRIATWREQRCLAKVLRSYSWAPADRILDMPCGTGILGHLLGTLPSRIVVSDISRQMMTLGRPQYPPSRLMGCLQSDITAMPFRNGAFRCVTNLGFLHRVPPEVKRAAIREIARVSSHVVIATCSVDTRAQRLKHRLLGWLRGRHLPAPCPAPLHEVSAEFERNGLRLVRAFMVIPFLSAEAVLVLEKPAKAPAPVFETHAQ